MNQLCARSLADIRPWEDKAAGAVRHPNSLVEGPQPCHYKFYLGGAGTIYSQPLARDFPCPPYDLSKKWTEQLDLEEVFFANRGLPRKEHEYANDSGNALIRIKIRGWLLSKPV